jgi:hypothetical protein
MKKLACMVGGLALLGVLALTTDTTGAQEKPKYTIAEVMQKAHKSGLLKKVAAGKASPEEQKQLAEMYLALTQNKPPKGDEAAWKKKTEAMSALAKKVAAGDKEAHALLAKEVNCGACHGAFKP